MSDLTVNRQELMKTLRLTPHGVRTLIGTWSEWLSDPASGRFSAQDVARLQVAARMGQRGYAREEIEAEIRQVTGESLPGPASAEVARSETAAAASRPLAIQEEISQLRHVLAHDLERQRHDRDRILMALMRTQQEVMMLRGEIGLRRTRRERKKSIWDRLRRWR